MVDKVVSGGQTGADRAALEVARELGLATGGWVPRGRLAEDGVIPERYEGLRETASEDVACRTKRNVRDADATVPRTADGLHPLCAAYARRTAPLMRRLIDEGVRQVQEALGSLRLHIVEGEALAAHDPDGRLLHNINTPDDYARAIALIE